MKTISYRTFPLSLMNIVNDTLEYKKLSVATRRQVACVIYDKEHFNILSLGYNHNIINGNTRACCEGHDGKTLPTVIHAEENAIFNFLHEYNIEDINSNTVMITTFFPCWWCAKLIVQSKIKNLLFIEFKLSEQDTEMKEVLEYLEGNKVKVTHITDIKQEQIQ